MTKKTIGLIGAGKWGKNYIKLSDILNFNIKIANRYNWKELINSRECDAFIIATPPDSHIEIALECVINDYPVMIEKPLALSSEECLKLKPYENKIPILVNNIHLFSPVFEKICNIIKMKDNNITNIISKGHGIGPFREYSSLFDYGPHDISMSLYLTEQPIESIINNSRTITEIDGYVAETYDFTLKYKNFNHDISVGNANIKRRIFNIETSASNYDYDDCSMDKFHINNKSQQYHNVSPLENATGFFLKSIDGYSDKRFGLDLNIRTMKIIESVNIFKNYSETKIIH